MGKKKYNEHYCKSGIASCHCHYSTRSNEMYCTYYELCLSLPTNGFLFSLS